MTSRTDCCTQISLASALGPFLALAWLAGASGLSATEPGFLPRAERSDEELLILRLEIGSHVLSQGLLCYSAGQDVLLPLGFLAEKLELPLALDLERGRVEGRVQDPERPFVLDLVNRIMSWNGSSQAISPDALVEAHSDDLYIAAGLLERWLSLAFEIDRAELRILVSSTPPLPILQRLDRRSRWQSQGLRTALGDEATSQLSMIEGPRRLVAWPAIDTALELGWRRSSEGETSQLVRYSALAQGDLLGMTADLFWGGDLEDGAHRISSRRFTLSRTDPEAGLLGPLQASEVKLGDLSGIGHPLVTFGRTGRGASLGRGSYRTGTFFDAVALRGDVLPGWDVELYRNGQLLAFTTAGTDGRYEFLDVPLLAGPNQIRISMFGPHGERRERVENLLVGTGALPRGEVRYQLHLLEEGQGLLGISGDLGGKVIEGERRPAAGETVLGGTFELGLSRRWTASTGALVLPLESAGSAEPHVYGWLGLEGSVLGATGRLELVRDLDGGWAGRLVMRRRVGSLGIGLEHRWLSSFRSDIYRQPGLTGLTELNLDGRIPTGSTGHLPISIRATWEQGARGGIFGARAELSHSFSMGSLRWAHRWSLETEGGVFSARGRGTLHGRLGQMPVRSRMAYEIWPEPELTQLDADLRRKRERMAMTWGLSHDMASGVTRASIGGEWQSRQVLTALSLQAGTDGRLTLQLSARFGLRRSRVAGRYRFDAESSAKQGEIEARVFLDHDDDGTFDPEDEPLEGVGFELGGARHRIRTGADGLAHLEVGAHRRIALLLAEGTLEDPYWLSSNPGRQVVSRPGHTDLVEFPVVATGEIDGTVFLTLEDGKKAVGGVGLELVDADGTVVAEGDSQYDGFYLFEKVRPGSYQLRIARSALEKWSLQGLPPLELEVGAGEVRSGVDLFLRLRSEPERKLQ